MHVVAFDSAGCLSYLVAAGGEALMKSHVGEVVRVALRRGPKRFEIVEIV